MRRRPLLLFVVLLVCSVAPLHAQGVPALTKGRNSIAFSVPSGGGGGLGFWKMLSQKTNVGVNLDVAVSGTERGGGGYHTFGLGLAPAFKRYWGNGSRVAPFFRGGPTFSYQRFVVEDTAAAADYRRESVGGGLSAGVGVDWFPVDQISIGGYTGASASVFWESAQEVTDWRVTTLTSGLTLHIYF